jgi:DNA repair protein RecN (Recombination protein N)
MRGADEDGRAHSLVAGIFREAYFAVASDHGNTEGSACAEKCNPQIRHVEKWDAPLHNGPMPAMLTALRIRNLALVEELEWTPGPGFVAVTGETGAGKSVILGALKLVLGERADRSLIRTGADQCSVEAVFQFSNPEALNRWLEDQGAEPCTDGELILKRVFTSAGANRQFINCGATTLAVLRTLGDRLVDLHGPHDHQSLFSTDTQLALLDAFAGSAPHLSRYEDAYAAVQRLKKERDELCLDDSALRQEMDLLRHQVKEIEGANLVPDEEPDLLARYAVASNGRRLMESGTQLLRRLEEDEESAISRLAECQRLYKDLARLDPKLQELAAGHESAVVMLEENASALRDYLEDLDLDPARLAELEDRVNLIQTLKRKYGGSIEEAIEFGRRAAERLARLESRGEELDRIGQELEKQEQILRKAGDALGKVRRQHASTLAKAVREHLAALGFKQAGFEVSLVPHEEPHASGLESVEFLFAPNPGEPAMPLRSIASSGEISRVMLALKTALAGQDEVALLVFDEIDANVGGEIANAVAAKMEALSKTHQVLCITHLPQVAARAASQFVVEKQVRNGRTRSVLHEVKGEDRKAELARMLGGASESANAHASALLAGTAGVRPSI